MQLRQSVKTSIPKLKINKDSHSTSNTYINMSNSVSPDKLVNKVTIGEKPTQFTNPAS